MHAHVHPVSPRHHDASREVAQWQSARFGSGKSPARFRPSRLFARVADTAARQRRTTPALRPRPPLLCRRPATRARRAEHAFVAQRQSARLLSDWSRVQISAKALPLCTPRHHTSRRAGSVAQWQSIVLITRRSPVRSGPEQSFNNAGQHCTSWSVRLAADGTRLSLGLTRVRIPHAPLMHHARSPATTASAASCHTKAPPSSIGRTRRSQRPEMGSTPIGGIAAVQHQRRHRLSAGRGSFKARRRVRLPLALSHTHDHASQQSVSHAYPSCIETLWRP